MFALELKMNKFLLHNRRRHPLVFHRHRQRQLNKVLHL
jgi:hypothetical protein